MPLPQGPGMTDQVGWREPRVRRTEDAALLVVVVLVLAVVIATSAASVGTADALERDLSLAVSGLPLLGLSILSFAGGVGALLLPVALALDLARRHRLFLVVEALAAAGVGAAVAELLEWLIGGGHLPHEATSALTRPLTGVDRTPPLSEVVVALVALLTVGSGSPSVRRGGALVVATLAASSFLSGDSTAVALACSVLLGMVVGMTFRVALGRPTTWAPQWRIEQALATAGLDVSGLEPEPTGPKGIRRFTGSALGETVRVDVHDRDTLASGVAVRILRLFRLRGVRRPSLTLRAKVEHAVLMGRSLEAAGVGAPRPLVVCAVGADSFAIAWQVMGGVPMAQVDRRLEEDDLDRLWQMLARLRAAHVAHRRLTRASIVLPAHGEARLAEVGDGDIAASDLALRLDVGQLLVVSAMQAGAEPAVGAAVRALGLPAVAAAVPVLQPVALNRETRAALRAHPHLLKSVQQSVLARTGEVAAVPEVELRRVTPRALVSVVGGTVAAYVILGQLSKVDLREAFLGIDWAWGGAVFLFAALTFLGASLALSGSAPVRLSLPRTVMTQLAVAFAALLAPAMVGNMAINARYLRRAGASAAAVAGTLGLTQIAQFGSYTGLLTLSAVAAGISPRASFTPPAAAVIAVVALVAAGVLALAVPRVRALVMSRFVPGLAQVVPVVLGVIQRPLKLAQLVGGALLLDASFVGALYCSVHAFGADTGLAGVAVVYFAGAIIGSAVPTPGGLGGVEAALTAGLIAVGTPGTAAVSAVLLYRVATYWLPIPVGWGSLHRLQVLRAL